MKMLIIIFLLPLAISAHRYRIPTDPNDAPFLPIFPAYPYTPKLMKRGVERDQPTGQIYSELYAPKPDARDSYTVNYQRDSHASTPTQNIYQAAYTSPTLSNQAYNPSTSYSPGSSVSAQHYNVNPYLYAIYNGYPVTLIAQSHSHNPRLPNNYYYHQPHQQYHPNYLSSVGASQTGQENDGKHYGKFQDITKNKSNIKDGAFVDGTNFLTNSKELDVSASTYRMPSHLNQENDVSDLHLRSAQLPRQMLQFVQYDGQHFRPSNYAVASGYKYQQLDQQLVNQALGKLFGQSGITNVAQSQYDIAQVNVPEKITGQSHNSPVIAKTGLAYIMNPTLNITPRHIGRIPDSYQNLESPIGLNMRGQKPVTTVTVEGSHGLYIPPTKLFKSVPSLTEYSDLSPPNTQIYEGSLDYKKNEPNYSTDSSHTGQPLQSYQYQYSGYQPTLNNQQQLDNYKITLDDVNFASKRNS